MSYHNGIRFDADSVLDWFGIVPQWAFARSVTLEMSWESEPGAEPITKRSEPRKTTFGRAPPQIPPQFIRGGAVESATEDGPTPHAWADGVGSGEGVEIFCSPEARRRNRAGDGEVALGKILYFFSVRANRRPGDVGRGPLMEYVLVYKYVTCGTGRSKKEEAAT